MFQQILFQRPKTEVMLNMVLFLNWQASGNKSEIYSKYSFFYTVTKKKKKGCTAAYCYKHLSFFGIYVFVLSFEIKVQAQEVFSSIFRALSMPNSAIFPLNKYLSPRMRGLICKCDTEINRFTNFWLIFTWR